MKETDEQKDLFFGDADAAPAELSAAAYEEFAVFTMDYLRQIHTTLSGLKPGNVPKQELIRKVVRLLWFPTRKRFEEFFAPLPALVRVALTAGAFGEFVITPPLEDKYGVTIIEKKSTGRYYSDYYAQYQMNPALELGLFRIVDAHTLQLPIQIRRRLIPWLPKPEGFDPAPIEPPREGVWTNEEQIADELPLAREALRAVEKKKKRDDILRRGLLKTERKFLHESCGLGRFPIAERHGLSSADLLARFLSAFTRDDSTGRAGGGLKRAGQTRTADPWDDIRALVRGFLSPDRAERSRDFGTAYRYLSGRAFEEQCLLTFVSKKPGYGFSGYPEIPPLRAFLASVVEAAAKTGAWYRVESLFRGAQYRGLDLSIDDEYPELQYFSFKAQKIDAAGQILESRYGANIPVVPQLRSEQLHLPVFRAYYYLLAVLGVVELGETEPLLRLTKNGKRQALSPYDGADAFRVTGFGAWCLGVAAEKPARREKYSLVLPDSNLLLLTFKGESLEKRLYLEKIGEKLGDERYRVTEAGFIAGCSSIEEIEERIEKFQALVTDDPPANWKQFFHRVRRKYPVFVEGAEAILFKLPEDPEIRELFSNDREIRGLVLRAEGGNIAVETRHYDRLAKILRGRGFFCPARPGV